MSNANLKVVKPARSAEREALAAAIEIKAATASKLRKASDALAAFDLQLEETHVAKWHAHDALVAAREKFADALRANGGSETAVIADCMRAGEPMPRQAIAKAEQDAADAKRNSDLGDEGLLQVQAAADIARQDDERASRILGEAATQVECGALAALLDEAEAMKASLIAKTAVIQRLAHDVDGVFANFYSNIDAFPARIRAFLSTSAPSQDAERIALEPWKAAHAALLTDPDAPLPEIRT